MNTSSGKTIMLIDDNQIDQMLHKRIVERSGLFDNILSYLYADEALEYLKGGGLPKPDIILLDINMPRMDGFEFLEMHSKLPADGKSAVVVMLTTSLDVQDKKRASEFDQVRGFVNKPLSEQILESIVQL